MYLDEVKAEENAKFIAKNAERIAHLEADKTYLEDLQGQIEEAKQLFEEYNPADEADRPDDWDEDTALGYEWAFFDLQSEVQNLQRSVAEVEGIKAEMDGALEEQRQAKEDALNEARGSRQELAGDLLWRRTSFEEAKFNPDIDPEELDAIRNRYFDAEAAYLENRALLQELEAEEARQDAIDEDMQEVYNQIDQGRQDDENDLMQWKTPFEDAELAKNNA